MTVNTISSIAEFDTNGVTTNFPFYFKFLASEDLVVTYIDPDGASSTLTLGTHYTVNGVGNDQGGSIITTSALAGPGQLVVSREMDAFQLTSLRNQGKFLAETHEDVFDKLTMLIQQGFAIFTRALTRPFGRDYFFAEDRRIASVKDPVDDQDAATKAWAQRYVGEIVGGAQGPINNASNVLYVFPNGAPRVVQDLSNKSDPAKGASGIGFSGRDVGAKLRDIVSAEDNGAFPDGTDVSSKLQELLNAGKTVVLTAGKTYVATGLVSVSGSGLVCLAGWAKLRDVTGTNTTTLSIKTPGFHLEGVEFDGGNEGPYKFFTSQPGTRKGLVIGNPAETGAQLQDVTVRRIRVHGYDFIGIEGRETVIGFSFGHRVVFENVNVKNCYVGWWLRELFEYSTGTNCYAYECFVGMLMVGGNNTFVASNFEENFQNLQMTGGYNHAHGKFVACSFNHAADGGVGFIGNGLINGHTFVGCTFWYSPITLSDCAGVSITQSQIVYGKVIIAGGGLNNIDDNYTPQGLVKEFSGNTFTTFRRNRVSYDTLTLNAVYGDVAMRSVASSTLPYPISFANTAGAEIPLTFVLKKWNGEDAAFLEQFGGAYLPKTAMYQVDMSIRFTTLEVGERPVLSLAILDSGGAPSSEIIESREFSAGQADCVISISRRLLLPANGYLRMRLKTKTATGVTIPDGGISMFISSAD